MSITGISDVRNRNMTMENVLDTKGSGTKTLKLGRISFSDVRKGNKMITFLNKC